MIELIRNLHEKYGKLAFGLICVMTLWKYMFAPLMADGKTTAQFFSTAAAHLEAATGNALRMTDKLSDQLEAERFMSGTPRRVGP